MFDWFKRKEKTKDESGNSAASNGTDSKEYQPTGQTMYSIGLTDENRVSLRMGYGEITMNSLGVQNLIDQLEVFKRQIEQNAVYTDEEV